MQFLAHEIGAFECPWRNLPRLAQDEVEDAGVVVDNAVGPNSEWILGQLVAHHAQGEIVVRAEGDL